MSSEVIDYSKDPAVINFQNYLKIRCVHPDIEYDECISFLQGQAAELGLPTRTHDLPTNVPVLVMTWEGLDPTLPTILLNSHMDVVPAVEGNWKHPPFAAEIEDGVIYGRGTQDMKSVSIQYLEAIRRLKCQGIRLKRTVHLTFVPDVKIICTGRTGHGSMLLPENSGEKVRYIIDKFMDLREMYRQKLIDNSSLTVGDITTINLTKLEGGIQTNIVPDKFTATFDVRLATTANHELFEAMINRWCKEAGDGVTCEYEHKDPYVAPTPMDATNPYWVALKRAVEEMGVPLLRRTMPCTTDARFLRGARALNLSPARRVAPAPHQRDESLPLAVFVYGITVYENILKAVGNV